MPANRGDSCPFRVAIAPREVTRSAVVRHGGGTRGARAEATCAGGTPRPRGRLGGAASRPTASTPRSRSLLTHRAPASDFDRRDRSVERRQESESRVRASWMNGMPNATACSFPGRAATPRGMHEPFEDDPLLRRGIELLGFDPFASLAAGTGSRTACTISVRWRSGPRAATASPTACRRGVTRSASTRR